MEKIVSNLAPVKARRATMNGRDYLVADMTLIVPGVLNGSRGALYYPPDEIARDVSAWDHVPLVVYHPAANGLSTSARDPDVLDRQGVGVVLRARADKDGKLKAEGWFDVEALKRVDNRVMEMLLAGKKVELSTGLRLDAEPAQEGAAHNGRPYQFVARNFRPDHLAVLPDAVGACSLADGCGVLVNGDQKKSLLAKFAAWLGLAENEMSYDDIRGELQKKLMARFSQDEPHAFVAEVFDDFFVYVLGDKTFRLNYSKGDDGVELDDDPEEVRVETTFVPVGNESDEPEGGTEMANKLSDNERKGLVDYLVANCDCWGESDRDTLNKLGDDKLRSLKDNAEKVKRQETVANAARQGFTDGAGNAHVWNEGKQAWDTKPAAKKEPAPPPVANLNDADKPPTVDEYLASAPPEVQSMIRNAMADQRRYKESVIAKMVENVKSDLKKSYADWLLNKFSEFSKEDMERIAALLPQQRNRPEPNYVGAAGPALNVSDPYEDDVWESQTINWEQEAAKRRA